VVGQCGQGPFRFMMKGTGTGDCPHCGRDRGGLGRGPGPCAAVQERGGDGDGQDAGGRVRGAAGAAVGVVAGLEGGGGAAEGGHRMTAARVTEQRVHDHACCQPGRERPA